MTPWVLALCQRAATGGTHPAHGGCSSQWLYEASLGVPQGGAGGRAVGELRKKQLRYLSLAALSPPPCPPARLCLQSSFPCPLPGPAPDLEAQEVAEITRLMGPNYSPGWIDGASGPAGAGLVREGTAGWGWGGGRGSWGCSFLRTSPRGQWDPTLPLTVCPEEGTRGWGLGELL